MGSPRWSEATRLKYPTPVEIRMCKAISGRAHKALSGRVVVWPLPGDGGNLLIVIDELVVTGGTVEVVFGSIHKNYLVHSRKEKEIEKLVVCSALKWSGAAET